MDRQELMNEEDEYEERRGFIDRVKSIFAHGEDYEEEEEMDMGAPAPRPASRQTPLLRVDHARANAIYVRLDFRSMQDAQAAADRLKERRPVIVNFERTDGDIARRGVDFISGVTYALDGFYQKIGENVFLFTPSNTAISVEDTDSVDRAGAPGLF